MKKLLSILALALCFVACQNEAVESVNNGDLANVVLTIDAPELGVTRADGDTLVDGTPKNGKNSAYGAIDFLSDADWDNYDLRYILEVYGKDDNGTGEPIYRERLVNCLDKYAPTTFELRLVPERTYKFVVFADFVAEGSAEATDKLAIADLYYNTADLNNISAITTEPTWGAMNEIRDAYFISQNVKVTNGLNETLTLTRPFAKLRVIATDLDYIAGYSKPGYVVVQYHDTDIIKSFNAVNGKLNTDTMTEDERTYKFNVDKNIPYTEGYDAETTNQTLFTDYLFAVEGEQTPVNFTIAVYEDATMTKLINEHDFNTQIPIQRNHLTTLIGDILTTQANITIEIDDNFADPEYVVGYKDPNLINAWESGVVNTDGNFEFTINKGENEFTVIVNGAAVQNKQLTVGNYVWEPNADDAEDGSHLTFTVKNLPATRAVATLEVLDGTMNVAVNKDKEGEYIITLDLLTKNDDGQTHRSVYEYTGAILFGETLDTPVVETKVEGNTITVSWKAVEDATSYFVAMNGEEAVETTELSKVYTDLEWETEYTFSVYAKNDTLISVTATVKATTDAAAVVVPTALATPVVEATVEGNLVTLSWEAIDGAKNYTAKYGEKSLVVEGTTATFDAVVGTYTASVVANPADETKNTVSEAGTVEVTFEPTTLTIAEVLKVAENTAVNTAGQVMAVYQKGFIMSDNTGTIVVYTSSAPSVKVGNNIALSGTLENYFGTLQIASPTITANDDATTAPVYPTPIDLTDQTAYDAYETFGTDNPTTFPYVKIKGTLSNGRYITVGTSTKQSMFNFSNSDYSAMNGLTITTVAYIIGYHSTNGYYQLVETSVEAEPYISAPENVNVAASATSATINVSANVAWDVTCNADWVDFTTTDTAINVTFAANELEEPREATFTLSGQGVGPVTVTLTQGAKPAAGEVEGGSSDFNTISSTSTSYGSGKTTAGWAYTNCAVFKGGTSDSSPSFTMIGDASNRALCMNGKTSAKGTITSPTITTGCGTLKFNYGLPFGDKKIKFTVDIIQNGETVQTFTVEKDPATKYTKYSFEETIGVAGEFQIVFKNLSPSNSTDNKDRTAIWDVEWTGKN